jgi:class 3 adenylate cyclase/CheY-like chemotaxis protein
VNHILGYTELLLDEAQDRAETTATAQLQAIHAAGQQVLALINERLDPTQLERDATGPSLADALDPLLDEILQRTAMLRTTGSPEMAPDLQRIDRSVTALRTLVHDRFAVTPAETPPHGGEPSSVAPAVPRHDFSSGALRAEPLGGVGTAHGALLVVDDNQPNRDMLARRLERLGYTVSCAEDGRQALDALERAEIDLVLLDIMMPVMDGYEVLAERQRSPRLRDIPFIVISASDELASVVRCIEMGAEDYLPKPFNSILLQARIGACLEKKRLRDQEKAHLGTIEAQAAELAEWNRTLEARVQQQVDELERVGRLRRFLAPQLAELIVSSGDERLLDSHRREITVVFTDLRGFTAFAETAEPEELMTVLREYHQAMGELIFRYEGTLERFAGDGLMVFFNDPVPCSDPAERAVRMAVAMRERVGELTRAWRKHGHDLGFGVGIALGYATLGRIGFEGRFDYGAIGTVTNLAARLCGEAEDGQILVSQRVHVAVEDLVEATPLGELSLKGFHRSVAAFDVLGLQASASG